jgi:hypothetical protein
MLEMASAEDWIESFATEPGDGKADMAFEDEAMLLLGAGGCCGGGPFIDEAVGEGAWWGYGALPATG